MPSKSKKTAANVSKKIADVEPKEDIVEYNREKAILLAEKSGEALRKGTALNSGKYGIERASYRKYGTRTVLNRLAVIFAAVKNLSAESVLPGKEFIDFAEENLSPSGKYYALYKPAIDRFRKEVKPDYRNDKNTIDILRRDASNGFASSFVFLNSIVGKNREYIPLTDTDIESINSEIAEVKKAIK